MSPPTVPRTWKVGVGILWLLVVLYSVVIMQQFFLGIFVPALLIAVVYFLWRVLKILEMKYEQPATETEDEDPLETLKRRYAEGEISDDEFEHRLSRLLEADNPDLALSDMDVSNQHTGSELESERG